MREELEPVVQEDPLGCAVACVAFILRISYQESLKLFKDGELRARTKANFYCKELVQILNRAGLEYKYKYIKERSSWRTYKHGSIVFIKRSRKYPYGHYLCRTGDSWMDPWINLPNQDRKAGFRKSLPGKPIYVVYPCDRFLKERESNTF